MLKVFFVRHALPEHDCEDNRTRPLSEEGKKDSLAVKQFFEDKEIECFYSSPYKRSLDTIADSAKFFSMEIIIDERFREREAGLDGNNRGMFQKRWENHEYHEEGGESIKIVQERNIAALQEIMRVYQSRSEDISIVIGTHGTSLSTILNYYNRDFDCDSFLRIIDWMPFIIELDFEGEKFVGKQEHLHIEKAFLWT